ncbi:MAG TPA: hypothetical protein VNO30_18010 [Kofleriaceae bacterium]|nr:hypothetical protein [Kofleriaceae bacterium]
MRAAVARIAVAGSLAASAGCFYVEPINQRPALDIRPASDDPVFRGATVTLEAVANDPEGQIVAFQWRVYACTDATSIEACDLEPMFTGVQREATFLVPAFRADPDGEEGPKPGAPVESLRVVLEGRDDLGAAARPDQELILPVLNAPPSVALRVASAHGTVITTPIDVYARYADADDAPANVTLEWTAFSPSQVPDALTLLLVPPDGDPGFRQEGRRFTPQVTGNWDFRVIATDKAGAQTEEHLTITVAEDGPPCLGAWAPVASAQPTPLTQPTLFRVLAVRDDLDAFPRLSAASFVGEPEFQWSLKVGAGPRQLLPNATSSLAIDPLTYDAGTVLDVRVEVFDRKRTAITCADAQQTCSVISQPACIQRQTWRVEAR